MSKQDVNVVVLTGNLVSDPNLSYQGTANLAVCKFKIANNTGSGKYAFTNWVDVKAVGKQAENVAKYLKKGRQVSVTGKLHMMSGKNDSGDWWNYTFVDADTVVFMNGFDEHEGGKKAASESKPTGPASGSESTPYGSKKDSSDDPMSVPPGPFGDTSGQEDEGDGEFEDDIPF